MTLWLHDIEHSSHARYWPAFLTKERAAQVFAQLKDETPWAQEEVVVRGRRLMGKRLTATYGDHAGLTYGYAGVRKRALPWTPLLQELRDAADATHGVAYSNYAVINLYRDGSDVIGHHSDGEKDLVTGAPILSVSLGAERDFVVKPKAKARSSAKPLTKALASGSLLSMEGDMQKHYTHAVPARKRCREPRINITFRQVRERDEEERPAKRVRRT